MCCCFMSRSAVRCLPDRAHFWFASCPASVIILIGVCIWVTTGLFDQHFTHHVSLLFVPIGHCPSVPAPCLPKCAHFWFSSCPASVIIPIGECIWLSNRTVGQHLLTMCCCFLSQSTIVRPLRLVVYPIAPVSGLFHTQPMLLIQ
jgi:hypothetical protein